MNYTKNHHLPQWVSSDRVRMADFNSAMANIESGLNTADTALAKANAAETTAEAAYSPDNKPYAVGSYTGTGETVAVHIGFRPSFLIVSGMKATPESELESNRYFAITGGEDLDPRVQCLSYGFAVYRANNAGWTWPMLTEKGRVYHYIAFR